MQEPHGDLPNGYDLGLMLSMKPSLHDVRRDGLKLLIEARFDGNKGAFADFIGKKRPQIYRLFSSTSTPSSRGIGEALAREVERKLNLPSHWLDKAQFGLLKSHGPLSDAERNGCEPDRDQSQAQTPSPLPPPIKTDNFGTTKDVYLSGDIWGAAHKRILIEQLRKIPVIKWIDLPDWEEKAKASTTFMLCPPGLPEDCFGVEVDDVFVAGGQPLGSVLCLSPGMKPTHGQKVLAQQGGKGVCVLYKFMDLGDQPQLHPESSQLSPRVLSDTDRIIGVVRSATVFFD